MIERIKMKPELYPVEAFFNRLGHDDFISALSNFSNGLGYNPEDMTCFFPSDIVEDEGGEIKDYKYIEFWEYSSKCEVRLEFDDFISILQQAAKVEIELNPVAQNKIDELVRKTNEYLLSF